MIPYCGIPYTAFASIEAQKYLMNNYETNSNDVYLISYPKAGQHWLKKICVELIRHHDKDKVHPIYSTGDIGMNSVPWKENLYSQAGEDLFNERIESLKNHNTFCLWWTHNPYSLFPANKSKLHPNTKYIVINRHPKDVLISYWCFMNNLDASWGGFDPKLSLNDFFLRFISGLSHFGCYYQWTLDWFNAYENNDLFKKMLFVYYEDILDNPYKNIRLIKDFLYGKDDGFITNDDIENIVKLTKFDSMKQEHAIDPQSMPFAAIHFRNGQKNDWKNYLDEDQSELLDEIMWIKWGHDGTGIKYYEQVMDKYSHLYNFGYHDQSKENML